MFARGKSYPSNRLRSRPPARPPSFAHHTAERLLHHATTRNPFKLLSKCLRIAAFFYSHLIVSSYACQTGHYAPLSTATTVSLSEACCRGVPVETAEDTARGWVAPFPATAPSLSRDRSVTCG